MFQPMKSGGPSMCDVDFRSAHLTVAVSTTLTQFGVPAPVFDGPGSPLADVASRSEQ